MEFDFDFDFLFLFYHPPHFEKLIDSFISLPFPPRFGKQNHIKVFSLPLTLHFSPRDVTEERYKKNSVRTVQLYCSIQDEKIKKKKKRSFFSVSELTTELAVTYKTKQNKTRRLKLASLHLTRYKTKKERRRRSVYI